jgi:tripeptidyl-peptidase-1
MIDLLQGDGESDPSQVRAVFWYSYMISILNLSQSECIANDGTNRPRFLPTFPSTVRRAFAKHCFPYSQFCFCLGSKCPYVVSVGGTRYINEIGVDFSGGGFSNYFQRPAWQEVAVAQAKKHLPKGAYQGLYNS